MSFWNRVMPRSAPANVPSPDQDRELVLYKYDSCPFCYRVKVSLDRMDVEVELRDVMVEPTYRQELRDKTGRTQVPCLFIDGEPLFESADIVDWLERYSAR